MAPVAAMVQVTRTATRMIQANAATAVRQATAPDAGFRQKKFTFTVLGISAFTAAPLV
jgi:hypothetical protein